MMGAEKPLVNVNKGHDAYSVIGNYILNHVTAIEDMIAVIQINGVIIKELYMVDVDADGYFYWKSDWWEGEEDVALLDFFPVSDAEAIPTAAVVPTDPQEIGYGQCANTMLKMWMDNVVTDGEYNRIMDRLNKLYFSGGERKG